MQIRLSHNELLIQDPGPLLNLVRALPSRQWDGKEGVWRCPYVRENYDAMARVGLPVQHIPRPERSGYMVDRPYGKMFLLIRTLKSPTDVERCRRIPEFRSFSPKDDGWLCRPSVVNIEYIRKAFPQAQWTQAAIQLAEKLTGPVKDLEEAPVRQIKPMPTDVPLEAPNDYKFRTPPYRHQLEAFLRCRSEETYALFMEQGTGKTKVVIDEAAYHFMRGTITGLVIVCPNSVKTNWEEELDTHCPTEVQRDVFVWEGRTRHKAEPWVLKAPRGERPLRVLIMNVEAFSTPKGEGIAKLFLSKHTCMMVVDESSRIKTPGATRTKRLTILGRLAKFRRILSGTPVTQSPLDIFSQMKFLDPHILGYTSFYTFRNKYAVLGGFNMKQVVGYVNLDDLQERVDKKAFRVLKVDCLDLPDKVYEKRVVELTPAQRDLYDQMKSAMVAEAEALGKVEVQYAITQIMRMQQIVGGFLPVMTDEGKGAGTTINAKAIPGGNPKLDALMEIAEETTDKLIIWARFRAEIQLIAEALRAKYGDDQVVEFHGGVTELERTENRRRFQRDPRTARFFVGQPRAGGIGLTLTAAHTVVYYSNDDSLEARLQSEDRAHRIGQTKSVTYIDIMATKTTDQRIVAGLRNKKGLADLITGDPTLSWL